MSVAIREVEDLDANTVDDRCPECNEYESECVCVNATALMSGPGQAAKRREAHT